MTKIFYCRTIALQHRTTENRRYEIENKMTNVSDSLWGQTPAYKPLTRGLTPSVTDFKITIFDLTGYDKFSINKYVRN